MLYLLRNCLLLTSDNHFTPFLLAATYACADWQCREVKRGLMGPLLLRRNAAATGSLAVGKQGTRLSGEHYACVMLSEHLRGALDVGINAQLPVRGYRQRRMRAPRLLMGRSRACFLRAWRRARAATRRCTCLRARTTRAWCSC